MTRSFTYHCGNTGVQRTPNKSQHTKLTLEKKILPPLLAGFELATFRSRVRRSNQQAVPAVVLMDHIPFIWFVSLCNRVDVRHCCFYLTSIFLSTFQSNCFLNCHSIPVMQSFFPFRINSAELSDVIFSTISFNLRHFALCTTSLN